MMTALRFVHFEIPASDPESLVSFYGALLGWEIEKAAAPGFDYWMCRTGNGPGIDGAITRRLVPGQGVTNYLTVEAIEPLAERAVALGGKLAVPRSPVPGMGWYALLLDPEGNPLGLWQKDRAAGIASSPVPGTAP